MSYIVRINYVDGQEVNVALPKEEVEKFLEKVSKNEAYWAPNEETAFWTPSTQVRYTNVSKAQPQEKTAGDPSREPILKDELPACAASDVMEYKTIKEFKEEVKNEV